MVLPQSADVSSSTLALSRTGSPSLQPLSPPPPREVEKYEKRALPPVPLKRDSIVSNFSKEVDEALATPDPVDTPEGSIVPFIYCPPLSPRAAPEDGDAEFVEDIDYPTDSKPGRGDLKLATGDLSGAATASVISPKVAKILGVGNPRKNTPSGHESPEKVKRLVGFELACEGGKAQHKQHRSEQYGQLHGEVSPLSNASSPYEHDGPRTAVSDVDAEAEVGGRQFSSAPSPSDLSNPERLHRHSTGSSPFPSPLRIVKPVRPSRSPHRKGTETPGACFQGDMDSGAWSGRPTPSDRPNSDLYHEAAKQLAMEDALAAQRAKQNAARQLTIQQLLQEDRESSAGGYHRSRSTPTQLPALPHQYQPSLADTRPSRSTERLQPIWRPPNAQQDCPRAVSASTFGRLTPRFHVQERSALPYLSPEPGPRSVFEFDSDDHGAGTVGTPETGGSIPLSIPSSGGDCPNSASRPRHTSSSMMAKVFRRISASPTTPTPPVPNNTPLEASFPRSSCRPHYRTDTFPSIPTMYSHSSFSTNNNIINNKKIKAKPSMSALASAAAAKTNDIVSAAAEFIANKSSMSMGMGVGGKERQRQRLKSSIRVLPDGRQVMAPGSFASASCSSSSFPGPDTGTALVNAPPPPPGSGRSRGGGGGGDGGDGVRGRMGSVPAPSAAPVMSPDFDYAGMHAAGREMSPGRPGLGYSQTAGGSNVDLGYIPMGRESPSLRTGSGSGNGGEKSARSSPVPDRGRG
ncbi:uncharacterized protein B0T15DRAFT_488323 [Chaetomium strumarium]|uniref:Uncharacterized protein n=1 Tax=Chaetomium strumarium TaxID=1170767 RepID=A0AAJ0H0J4_9PEZI|nr:hypothetical protein B0T15DRAFT_488323 [Chaetomium strumarium]